jgi:hypothetical protein
MELGKSFCSMTTLGHVTKGTKVVACSLGWEVLPHAAYSPDLAPSDYHLFRSLQHYLPDTHFKTVEKVRKSIDFIASKPPYFFRDGIHQLPERWSKVIENNGEYFQD